MDTTRDSGTFLDEDIDFDMLLEDDDFAEPAPGKRGAGIRRKPKDAYRPSRLNVSPNWSRIAAAAFISLLVLGILWLAVSSFRDSRKQAAFRDYANASREVMVQSDAQGQELDTLMSQSGGTDRAQLVASLDKLAGRAGRLATDAEKLDVPQDMQPAHQWLITTLEYRQNGFLALRKAMTGALVAKDRTAAAKTVATANQRFLASDVIYDDSYMVDAREVLNEQEINGVRLYDSSFLKDPEMASPAAMKLALDRLASAAPKVKTGKDGKPAPLNDGKVHGGQLTETTVSPSGQILSTTGVTTIAGSDSLAFEVTFQNQGEVQETNIPVTITITGDKTDPVELTGEIEQVDPGETGSVRIPLNDVPDFAQVLTMKITAGPVPGEKTTDNNAATYQVMFKL